MLNLCSSEAFAREMTEQTGCSSRSTTSRRLGILANGSSYSGVNAACGPGTSQPLKRSARNVSPVEANPTAFWT